MGERTVAREAVGDRDSSVVTGRTRLPADRNRLAQLGRDEPLEGRVNAESLRRWCLARPSAVEEFPFGPETSVFKVGGKMFARSLAPAVAKDGGEVSPTFSGCWPIACPPLT
jgi:hypothetical protein